MSIPCRVSADLAAHEATLREADHPVFDEYDDAMMHDIVGNKCLAKPVQELLVSLHQIELAQGSFGDPDKARVFEQLLPELKALRQACIDEWRNL